MGSAIDAKHVKRQNFRFPLSPPSSGTVTALSSPRLDSLSPEDPKILDRLLASSFRQSHSLTPVRPKQARNESATDSDGYNTARSARLLSRKRPRKAAGRALTLPSGHPPITTSSSNKSLSKTARLASRRSSYSSSTSPSTSSPPTSKAETPTLHSSGIGRKVAATLQLFKETACTTDDPKSGEPSTRAETSSSSRKTESFPKANDVAEAQFEFVKRSEWPDRETAAVRREKSTTTLERVRTKEGNLREVDEQRVKERKLPGRESTVQDLTQRRKDAGNKADAGRGRRRERVVDEHYLDPDVRSDVSLSRNEIFNDTSPPFTLPRSRPYPPSPSPSRSPTGRITPVLCQNHRSGSPHSNVPHRSPFNLPPLQITTRSSRSPPEFYPQITSHTAPISPLESSSSWSTDDESTWDTASATTASPIAITPPIAFSSTHHKVNSSALLHHSPEGVSISKGRSAHDRAYFEGLDGDILTVDLNASEDHLPHIPLRPFRNQVGGHSAIYKFTKQAVCKPLVSRENLFYESVERDAPPLLGFIPRYLGVMLVSYRRVPKAVISDKAHVLSDSPRALRFPLHHTASSDTVMPLNIPTSKSGTKDIVSEQDGTTDQDADETEMPEVVLDRNRHIIPQWMLHGGRNRSMSSSNANGYSTVARRQLQRDQRGTASSPDLAIAPSVSNELDAPTPVNSPSQLSRSFPFRLAEKPSPLNPNVSISDDEGALVRPGLRPFNSDKNFGMPGSQWFGGTGSTMVNTRLKDHVFSSVLRRFRRRVGHRCEGTARTEDERDAAVSDDISKPGVIRHKRLFSHEDPSQKALTDYCETPIRRVQSEGLLASPDKAELPFAQGSSRREVGVFEMDLDPLHGSKKDINSWHGIALPPSIARKRSRSRSLDSRPSNHTSYLPSFSEHATIPEGNESEPNVTRQNHFILMEDLTGRLKHPCVMDLKMGSRQYGMDAIPAKKKSQRKKCDRTTSRTLGVRVCGMQVWNHATQSYVTQDKYSGREVRPEKFDSVLASFLFDGNHLLAYQIPVLLQKLYALARIINRLKGYRFYGCSLLLIYDGDRETQEAFRSFVLEHPSSQSKRGESLERRSKSHSRSERPSLRRSRSEDLLLGPVAKRSNGRRKRGEINVRIVDFAHTTTGKDWLPYPNQADQQFPHDVLSSSKGYQADVDTETGLIYARFPPHYPEQPDRGFMLGLQNIALTLENIWNEERIHRAKVARENPSDAANQLPLLSTDGKEIFDEIFGGEEDHGNIST